MKDSFYIGLDLGQANDYTAIALLRKVMEWHEPAFGEGRWETEEYHLQHAERSRGVPYPDIVRGVKAMYEDPDLKGHGVYTVVDATGVGRPVVDMMKEAKIRPLVPVSIHGGEQTTSEAGYHRVPKRVLVSTAQVLLQSGRLKFAQDLEHADVLRAELQNFKVKINLQTGHDAYEAWREGDHDDLVLSLAIACWYAERPVYRRSTDTVTF